VEIVIKQEEKEFLLENYRQVCESRRTVDRKRDILLSLYIPGGSLLGIFSDGIFNYLRNSLSTSSSVWHPHIKLIVIFGWLIISGIVFWIITLYRRWHVEYDRIATAIHRSIMIENSSDVYGIFEKLAQKSPKESKKIGFGRYINPLGVEFWMAILALFIQVFVFLRFASVDSSNSSISVLILIGVAIGFVEFIFLYWVPLSTRERRVQNEPQRALGWYLQGQTFTRRKNRREAMITVGLVLIAIGGALKISKEILCWCTLASIFLFSGIALIVGHICTHFWTQWIQKKERENQKEST